jgi:hypothetical protein
MDTKQARISELNVRCARVTAELGDELLAIIEDSGRILDEAICLLKESIKQLDENGDTSERRIELGKLLKKLILVKSQLC